MTIKASRVMLSKVTVKKFLGSQPWWAKVVVLYIVSRLVSFVFLISLANKQGENPWGNVRPVYGDFINFWDSGWYYIIYKQGYPDALPMNDFGGIQENQWAFHPLYPLIVRVLSWAVGLDGTVLGWNILAPWVSFVAGLFAVLVLYKLFALFADSGTALWGVLFFSVSPTSPVLQVPYAEALSLLLLALALFCIVRKRYLLSLPVIALMFLSRPIGVAFGMMLGMVFCIKMGLTVRHGWKRESDREVEYLNTVQPFNIKEAFQYFGVGIFTALCALSWPIIAWWRTGNLTAYVDTETVWRGGGLVPVRAWIDVAERHAGTFGIVLFIIMALLFFWWVFSASMQRVGIVLEMWVLAYIVYLVLFLNPQSSTWRILLLPLVPVYLWLAMLSRDKYYRGAVLVAIVGWQYVWCASLWFYDMNVHITPP